jgi:hypothetical protein
MATQRGIAAFVLTCDAIYGEKFAAPTASQLEIWDGYLSAVSDEQLAEFIHKWDGEWPPTPADVRRAVGGERVYADRSHREFPSSPEMLALEGTFPDPLAKLREVQAMYRRQHLRVIEGDAS